MSFGKALEIDFYSNYTALTPTKTHRGKKGELFLIDCLKQAMDNTAKKHNVKTKVIHGNKSMTDFQLTCGCPAKNELGDMLFVVYDVKKRIGRVLVMQNKYEVDYPLPSQKFFSNPRQTCLMNGQGHILNCQLPYLISHISDKTMPPLCCYGIFYKHNNNQLYYSPVDEVQYSPALPGCIKTVTVRKTEHRNKPALNKIRSFGAFNDRYSLDSVEKFGNALLALELGKPIQYKLYKDIISTVKRTNVPKSFLDIFGRDIPNNLDEVEDIAIQSVIFLDVTGFTNENND